MVDAIHPARDTRVRKVTAAVIADIRLLATPGIKLADRLSKQFSLVFRVHRSSQLPRQLRQLRLTVTDLVLHDAAVAVAHRHHDIGRRRQGERKQQQGRQTHQS